MYVLYLLTSIFLAKIIRCTFVHPCPILGSVVLPLFLNSCHKVSGGTKGCELQVGFLFGCFPVALFYLEFSTPLLKHPSKKRGKKRGIKEISIHIPLYIHVLLGMVIWSFPLNIWGRSVFQTGHKLPLPPVSLSPRSFCSHAVPHFLCFIWGRKILFIVYDAVWYFFFVCSTLEWLWWFTFPLERLCSLASSYLVPVVFCNFCCLTRMACATSNQFCSQLRRLMSVTADSNDSWWPIWTDIGPCCLKVHLGRDRESLHCIAVVMLIMG
jgi:hypothetical protein